MRLSREYPHYGGWPVDPIELELPHTSLEPDYQANFNNHHMLFTARAFGRHAISLACRNLAVYQTVLPRDVHAILHDRYDPAPMPDLLSMMDRLDEAYQKNELLRFGSALHPTYKVLDTEMWRDLNDEYNKLDTGGTRIIIS